MKKSLIILVALVFNGCVVTQEVQLKKAIVKLIEENKKLNDKVNEQEQIIKEHNVSLSQQKLILKDINSTIYDLDSKLKKQHMNTSQLDSSYNVIDLMDDKLKKDFYLRVIVPVANLRTFPSVDATIRFKAKKGELLKVIDKTNGDYVWYKIKYKNEELWIYSSIVQRLSHE